MTDRRSLLQFLDSQDVVCPSGKTHGIRIDEWSRLPQGPAQLVGG
jgi:hypothetical protein